MKGYFPSTPQHYRDLLYDAYKSSNPTLYLREFLDPYSESLTDKQLRYLYKVLWNRDKLGKDMVMQVIAKEEQGQTTGQPLSRFIFMATAMCHIWYDTQISAFVYPLNPETSTFVCYKDVNVPVSYIWLDANVHDGQVHLIRSNLTSLQVFELKTMWLWTDGQPGQSKPVSKTYCYDMQTGSHYEKVSSSAPDTPILRIAVSGEDGRVGMTCELGMKHEWPFVIFISYTSLRNKYVLNKALYNDRSGHLLPLLCAMHPIPKGYQH